MARAHPNPKSLAAPALVPRDGTRRAGGSGA